MGSFNDEQLAFFARITASVTHELNNVIAVINEVAGLLGDMIEDIDSAKSVTPEQLTKIRSRLSTQVARGQTIIKRLNRFAHTADEKTLTFDLVAVMDNLTGLCERLAGMKKVKLDFRPRVDSLVISGNPFFLQQCFFEALRLVLDSDCAGDILTIDIRADSNSANIAFSGLDGSKIEIVKSNTHKLEAIMEEVHGRLQLVDADRSLVLSVPLTQQQGRPPQ